MEQTVILEGGVTSNIFEISSPFKKKKKKKLIRFIYLFIYFYFPQVIYHFRLCFYLDNSYILPISVWQFSWMVELVIC